MLASFGGNQMAKKVHFLREKRERPLTRRELIAASEFGKNPWHIADLAHRLGFIKPENRSKQKRAAR